MLLGSSHGALAGAIFKRCPAIGPDVYISYTLEISRAKAQELRELLEDTIEYFCDNELVSGELAWTITECLALAKQAEIKGLVVAD